MIDAALLLALWKRAATEPLIDAGDKLRQMKLAYLVCHDLRTFASDALTPSFYRWTWGPMSNDIYSTWEILKRSGHLDSEEKMVVTSRGAELAEAVYHEILGDEANIQIRASFDSVVAYWRARQDTESLLDHVYEMVVTPEGDDIARPIREIRKGTELFSPVDPSEARSRIHIDEGWLETLLIELKPGKISPIITATEDFRAGRFSVA